MDLAENIGNGQRHPWELERWAFFRGVLERHDGFARSRVLDVGSGDSWLACELRRELGPSSEVVCWDTGYGEDDLDDPAAGVRRTNEAPGGVFDLVMMLDVLEHIEDPETYLAEAIVPLLAPGALVLASVPAHQRLFDDHDVALAHFRRYSPVDFIDQLSSVCSIETSGSLFFSLVPPRFAGVQLGRVRKRLSMSANDDVRHDPAEVGIGGWSHGPVVTKIVRAALAVDAQVCAALAKRGRYVPGLSHWAIGVV